MFIRSLATTYLRAPDGGGSGDPAPTPAPASTKTFTEEYVKELREEASIWRKKSQGHEGDATKAKETVERVTREAGETSAKAVKEATDAADARVTEARGKADERVIRAELRAAATKAGMIDLDALKLLDTAALKLTEDGDVEGVDALIEAAKKTKPYLFASTGTGNPAPSPKPANAKSAKDMTDDEFTAAMRAKSWRS